MNVYLDNFDMISPWTVRQYVTLKEVDQFSETVVKGDVELLGRRNQDGTSSKVDYMPVVFPGYSVRGFPFTAPDLSHPEVVGPQHVPRQTAIERDPASRWQIPLAADFQRQASGGACCLRCDVGPVRENTLKQWNRATHRWSYRYDDGTALLPIVEKSRNLPKSAQNFRFLALDDDGFDLTNDWSELSLKPR